MMRNQPDTTAVVDTLTQAYSDIWQASSNDQQSGLIGFLSSNDLIFVVLAVTLIIWFVLLFFMIRIDRRIGQLEKENDKQSKHVVQ